MAAKQEVSQVPRLGLVFFLSIYQGGGMERIGIRGLPSLFIIAVLLPCFGCSSMSDVVRAKEAGREGTAQDYPVTSEEAWTIAKAVFRWEGADAIEEHKD